MSSSNSIKNLSGGPLRSNVPGLYTIVVEMEISTTTITSTVPTNAKQITVAHAGTDGDYTITFSEDLKPRRVIAGMVIIEEDQPEASAKWTGYTASTGVGTFSFYDEDDTSGIATQVDFTGTAQLVLFCSKTELADA
jgi:hypothetical protein